MKRVLIVLLLLLVLQTGVSVIPQETPVNKAIPSWAQVAPAGAIMEWVYQQCCFYLDIRWCCEHDGQGDDDDWPWY